MASYLERRNQLTLNLRLRQLSPSLSCSDDGLPWPPELCCSDHYSRVFEESVTLSFPSDGWLIVRM
jgi:hypothetical protein